MTSRLKRKLDNIGVDTNSQKLNENFCLIGTPLPALDKAKDKNEFVPVWKQDVRDEQGRRRLHGAFTGGFSAGYFNTVGSKEGWTPSTFISSRTSRASNKGARPEDFMDDEDLAELRDSQKLVDTTEQMDILGGTEAEMRKRSGAAGENDSIASALESLLPPPNDSVGAQLLRKMGWRLGHGIGPRITYKQLKMQEKQSSTVPSNSLPGETGDAEDEEAAKHLYAPRDTKVLIFRAKENSHGLGYVPGLGLNEMVDGSSKASSGLQISAGFGLGALNDADEDDLDVYASGYASNDKRRRLAFDDDDDDDQPSLSARHRSDRLSSSSKAPESTSGRFHDGRVVLKGYVVGDKPVLEDTWFKLPEIPKGWKPDPQRIWNSGDNAPKASATVEGKQGARSEISADQRGALLGEAFLKPAERSVFDYLSHKDRERLQNLKSGKPTPPSQSTATPELPTAPTRATTVVIPPLDASTASAALQGFQPFVTDPPKQARYIAYLNSQAQAVSNPQLQPAPGQSIDIFNKELEDFAKAARVFKPVSGTMANRFTSASIIDTGPTVVEGLHTPSSSSQQYTTGGQTEKLEEIVISPKANAAKAGMFGPLTRETVSWSPNRLLCKRFGVKDPYPEGLLADPTATTATAMGSTSDFATQFQNSSTPVNPITVVEASEQPPPAARQSTSGRTDIANIGMGEDDDQGRDTLTYERPAMDIFKAIFASDDEDSDEEEAGDAENLKPADESGEVQPLGGSTFANAPEPGTSKVEPSEVSYNPAPPPSEESGAVVDFTTFRPTFVSKAMREGKRDGVLRHGGTDQDKDKAKDRAKDKMKKDKKSKKRPSTLMSFQGEEEDGEGGEGGGDDEGMGPRVQVPSTVKRKKKKRRKENEDADGGMDLDEAGEDVWVEKVVVPAAGTPTAPANAPQGKVRMKAVDFL